MNIEDDLLDSNSKRLGKRPIVITIICIMGFLIAAYILFDLLKSDLNRIPNAFLSFHIYTVSVGSFITLGLWKMKYWAYIAYIVFTLINQIVVISVGVWTIRSLIIPLIVILLLTLYYKRFQPGFL